MSFPLKFHKPKCMIYLILYIIMRIINTLLIKPNIKYQFFKSSVFQLFLKSIFNTFAIFIYFYQKYYIEKLTYQSNKSIDIIDIQYYKFIPIIICGVLSYLLSDISFYNMIYTYQMKKINIELIDDFGMIILFISHVLNEKYFLNSKHYIHHYLSLSLVIIFLIIILILESYKALNVNFISFIYIILLTLESMYLYSSIYVIVKILNYQYFINISVFLFILGISELLILLIFDVFYVFIFHFDSKFIFKIGKINSETLIQDIILLIIFRIISLFREFFTFKIIEESKPSYTMIPYALYNITTIIINREFKLSIPNILYILIFFLFCIYLEIISLNFCNLDQYTNIEIAKRGEKITNDEIYMSSDTSSVSSSYFVNMN